MFAVYWQQRTPDGIAIEGTPAPVTIALDADDADDDVDDGDGDEPQGDVQQVRFSRAEVLTDKDFAECTAAELVELSALMARLRFTTHRRRSRRQVPSRSATERPDLRRTVRWALRHHGEPVKRAFTEPASRPRRLVLVLDVSGSMEPYARALLRFAHAAVVARAKVEVFVLGTRLPSHQAPHQPRPRRCDPAGLPQGEGLGGGTRLGEGSPGVQQRVGGAGPRSGRCGGGPQRRLGSGAMPPCWGRRWNASTG